MNFRRIAQIVLLTVVVATLAVVFWSRQSVGCLPGFLISQVIIGGQDSPTRKTEYNLYAFGHEAFPNDLTTGLHFTHMLAPFCWVLETH